MNVIHHPDAFLVSRPLTADELSRAHSRLPSVSDLWALAALALPADLLPDAVWHASGTAVIWRGAVLSASDASDAAAVAAWAASRWQVSDRGLVPSGSPASWTRLARSGAGWVLWGPAQLWAGPEMTCGSPDPAIFTLAAEHFSGAELQAPAVVSVSNDVKFLDGNADRWRLGYPAPAPTAPVPDEAQVAAALSRIAEDLDASGWVLTCPDRSTPHWVAVLDLSPWTATFDITAVPGALRIGRSLNARAATDPTAPNGWVPDTAAGSFIGARHQSGLNAVLSTSGPWSDPEP